MNLVLASTWQPRGELPRFQRLLPLLEQVYSGLVIALPPQIELALLAEVEASSQRVHPVRTPDWAWGRYLALKEALELPGTHVQYADLDRLLRWAETRPDEWRRVAEAIERFDCLVIGRTQAAYRTHPRALLQTEAISNAVISFLLGREMDVSAGSKAFSRRAAEFLIANTRPGRALGTDAEWPVLLQRSGFAIEYLSVDGLDWEIPDQYQMQAADPERQRRVLDLYDADPKNWEHRVSVAMEIVQSGLEALKR
jgi:hypothetical protein